MPNLLMCMFGIIGVNINEFLNHFLLLMVTVNELVTVSDG